MLGPARVPIPQAPSRFAFVGDHETTLCSRLHCDACQLPVKWHDGVYLTHEVGGLDAVRALYASGGAGGGAGDARLYLCQCAAYTCNSVTWLSLAGVTEMGWGDSRLPLTWCCAGHPPLTVLPLKFHGRTVGRAPDWPALIAHTFRSPSRGKPRVARVVWLRQLRGVVSATAAADAIDDVIRALLLSGDAVLRGHAIAFLGGSMGSTLPDLLPTLFLDDAERLRQQPDPMGLGLFDLYNAVASAIATHMYHGRFLPLGGPLLAALRAHALTPNRLERVGWMLKAHDPVWFLTHFDALLAASPETAARATKWRSEVEHIWGARLGIRAGTPKVPTS